MAITLLWAGVMEAMEVDMVALEVDMVVMEVDMEVMDMVHGAGTETS